MMVFSSYSKAKSPFWSHPNYVGYDAFVAGARRKPIECDICDRRFAKTEHMKQHKTDLHGVENGKA